jgi:hypothetical protein
MSARGWPVRVREAAGSSAACGQEDAREAVTAEWRRVGGWTMSRLRCLLSRARVGSDRMEVACRSVDRSGLWVWRLRHRRGRSWAGGSSALDECLPVASTEGVHTACRIGRQDGFLGRMLDISLGISRAQRRAGETRNRYGARISRLSNSKTAVSSVWMSSITIPAFPWLNRSSSASPTYWSLT